MIEATEEERRRLRRQGYVPIPTIHAIPWMSFREFRAIRGDPASMFVAKLDHIDGPIYEDMAKRGEAAKNES